MLLSQLLTADRIKVPLESRDKPSVIRELVELLARTAGGDPGEILHAVLEREDAQSTGFGHGVAIPHGRTPSLGSMAVVAGRAAQPVEFGSVDAQPVQLFFLVAGPESAAGDQVRALARIARLVRRDHLRERLIRAATPAEFVAAVQELEQPA